MFEIESDDVALLTEEDLRELVGRLCEAQLEAQGHPVSSVTRGGHQNAGDGGVDVRVALAPGTAIDGFVPRAATGFQVKRTDMPAGAIDEEMRPGDVLRPAIQDLANEGGAYIIVSSIGSVADFALRNRLEAMRDAVAGAPNAASLKLDFYDRVRLASWIRAHPATIPWVRSRIGRPIMGWQSFGAWSGGEDRVEDEYLPDEALRLKTSRHDDGKGFSPVEGIDHIRDLLRSPGQVVRLVGLSGVGKTRLAQALFDERVGNRALSRSVAAYTNLADSPDPLPLTLAGSFIGEDKRAILIVDNCPPELHSRLSEVCRAADSTISVLTIEYDIREDEPEGTEVVELEPASAKLIEQLIQRRRPDLSEVDARTISEFSGGNARIAFALAKTIEKNGSVVGLKDEQLFRRLFQQRHDYDANLLSIAEACSLVYSFNGEDISDGSEIAAIALLISKPRAEVFRNVAELLQRDLLQKRGQWRAVLPHAIANRLAADALKKIPIHLVKEGLISKVPGRLAKSFSRRIGYLHGCQEATQIAKEWFAPSGLLGNVMHFDEFRSSMFENAAPLTPDDALAVLERSIRQAGSGGVSSRYARFGRVARSIAFEEKFFERSVNFLADVVALSDDHEEMVNGQIESLFHLYLSGTHAGIQKRIAVIRKFLKSEDSKRQLLGLRMLRATLEASDFFADHQFDFGGLSRDYGYWPSSSEEVSVWFTEGLKLVSEFVKDGGLSSKVKALLADKFRGLWARVGLYDALEKLSFDIAKAGHWRDGWVAVRQTMKFDGDDMGDQARKRLSKLEVALRPADLLENIRSMVIGDGGFRDFEADGRDDDVISANRRTEAVAYCLGKKAAMASDVLANVLPDLLSSQGRLGSFGRGLAKVQPREERWRILVEHFSRIADVNRQIGVLSGYLYTLRRCDPVLCDRLLDEAVTDDRLAAWLPGLQVASGLDAAAVDRLCRALELGKAPIENYDILASGRATKPVAPPELSRLLTKIAGVNGGNAIAIRILALYFYGDEASRPKELLQAGRSLLLGLNSEPKGSMDDHWVSIVVKACILNEEGRVPATSLLRKLLENAKQDVGKIAYYEVLKTIIKTQPEVALDELLLVGEEHFAQRARGLERLGNRRKNLFHAVNSVALISWCRKDSDLRFRRAACVVPFSKKDMGEAKEGWTDEARALLDNAPNRREVLNEFARRFQPSGGWIGSLAARLESYEKLLDELDPRGDAAFEASIADVRAQLREAIARQKEFEERHERPRDETFE